VPVGIEQHLMRLQRIRWMIFKSPMWITPLSPLLSALGGGFTWLSSQ
jgi:hypothetical protein